MGGPKLIVNNITKTFTGADSLITALQDVSLTIKKGEIVSLIGPSGCGKSTLLDIIAGLNLPNQGDVFLDGSPIKGKKGFVSYMPQRDVLFPWRTILQNVIVPLEVASVSRNEAEQEALSLMPVFGLKQFAGSYPHELSGGMRQRAAFLRTCLCKKQVMLLDEPFGRLDALTRRQMQQWLLGIWSKFNQSILFVTHDVEEALIMSDRVYVMSPRPGIIVKEVAVNLPRPRSTKVITNPVFIEIKDQLLSALEEGILEGEALDEEI